MFEALAESMTSLLCDLSLEKAAGNIEDKLDRKQLSDKIREQITRYENEILPGLDGAEQFDFTGVNRYIKVHLFDKCKQPLFADSRAVFPGQSRPY